MSDPIQNFENILRKQSNRRPLGLYNANKQLNKHNFKPQDVISSVSLQLKAIQVADSIKSEKFVNKNLQKYNKSNFLSVNKLPVYVEVPKQSSKFDTQCVSDTQLISVIEDAEMIDVNRGMTQEFETTFCHHTEKQDIEGDDKTNADAFKESNKIICKDIHHIGVKECKEINNKVTRAEEISESNNLEVNTSISIISPIMCSNKTKDGDAGINTQNSTENYTQDDKFSPIINGCKEVTEELDTSIERPLSPIFMHKHVKTKPKTPSPLIFNLEKFEQFEKIVIPIIASNDLNSVKHVINSQILNKELNIKMDKEIELNEKDVLSPVLQNKNIEKHSSTFVEFETNTFKDADTGLEFIELDKVTSDDLVNKVLKENMSKKVGAESEILKDEILFSSDEEDSYVHKDYQDLPFTCALETSFYDQSDVLDKTMYVGFQTASNKTIQILTESFAQAKSLLSDVSSDEVTVTDLVKNCDSHIKNKTQNDEFKAKKDTKLNETEFDKGQMDDKRSEFKFALEHSVKTVSNFEGFTTASKKEIKLSDKALARCKKVFQDIDFSEKFDNETEIINAENKMNIGKINDDFKNKVKENAKQYSEDNLLSANNDAKPETNKSFDDDIIQDIDDAIIQEFENIEMSLEDEYKLADKSEATARFKTASCKDLIVLDTASLTINNIFKDTDFDEELSEINMKEINVKENALSKPSNICDGKLEGFKTASNRKIQISNEAIIKTKNLFQDIDATEFPNKSNKNLKDLDKPCTSFVGFKTANNKDIKISDEALAKTENIFKDIDSSDFKFPIKSVNDLGQNDFYVNSIDESATKTSFAGFKTANNKDVIISKEALTKTKNIFKDIDSMDIDVTKKRSKENIFHHKAKDVDEFIDFNQPSTSKTSHVGFKTANNKTINISDAALASTKIIFKDIDCADFKFQESRVPEEAEMYKIKAKDINDFETIAFDSINTKSKFIGFKTANNREIKISDAALTKTKNIFKDIDKVKYPSKPNEQFQENIEEKITEDDNKHTNDFENIVSTKSSNCMANFKTINNKKIHISEAALSKTRHIIKDLDSTDLDFPKKPNELDEVDSLERKEWSNNEYELHQPSRSKACFIGFKTANNKKIKISEESLAKTKNIFKDIDSNNFVNPKKHTKDLEESRKEERDQLSLLNKGSFESFKTGNNIVIPVSETALATTKNIFKDMDSNELQLLETNKKDLHSQPLNKRNFVGFKTGNNNVINISELAMAKTKNIFKDIDSTEIQLPEKYKKDYPNVAKYSDETVSSVTIQDKNSVIANHIITTDHFIIPEAVVPKFQGFQTASNKQVKISADALVKSRKIFQDIDVVGSNLEDEQILCTVNNNTVKDSDTHNTLNDIRIDDQDLPVGGSSPIFKGFQTANKQPVSISKDALAKSRKLFQDIDDFEPEFRGFQSPNDASSENHFTQVKNLEDQIKKSLSFKGFQTASDKKVAISEDALTKSRKVFRDIDKGTNISKKMTSNIKFGFKTGTNRDIVISEEALARSKRKFSKIGSSNVDTTDKKDKITEENIANIIDTQVLNNFEESLHTEDFHDTPVKSKRSGSPILSCPKAKRRKKFETPYSQKIPKPEIKKEIITKKVNTVSFNNNYKKYKKCTLKNLANNSTSNTTIDPYLLQFKLENLLQFEFRDSRSDLSYGNMTMESLKELFINSVNSKLIPKGWLDNHIKLILWKLISYEIKFNSSVVCSARNVVDQLKYRYDKELYNAQRPALRKILEKDDVPSKTIVLCVAGISVDGDNDTSATTTNNTELLLTDGWYCIKASLDKMLAKLVSQGKIVVGTKLVTNGAELVNCEQGISPWEDTSSVRLKIFGNSTRRARWDARLGYHGNGAILSHLSSVRLDGGKVSKLRVYVTRVYPALYVEKFEDGSTVTRSERLEHVHQTKSEAERQAIMEKIYEEVEKEFSDQESQDSESLPGSGNKRTCLDSGSQIAKFMKTTKDPAEFRSELTSSQTRLLEDHTSKRRERLLEDIQKRIRDKVEKAGVCVNRNVVPLLKIRVAGVSGKSGVEVTKGMMSIWKPTDSVLEIIKEGAWIDVMNVVPTAVRYSEIQISAGRQSVFSVSKYKESEQFKPYTNILNRTCFTIKDLAQNPSMSTDYNEIDTVGFIFLIDPSIQEFDSTKQPFQNVFLADADKNIICINFWGGLKKFGFQNVLDTGQIVSCANLQKRAGNTRKSIPHYRVTEFAFFTKTPKNVNARVMVDDLSKKFFNLDRRKFCEECVLLKNNYSLIKHNNENISPYKFNNSDYNISKHKMFIDSPLVRPNKADDNFNLTGLDFESTFKQTDTQNLPEEVLLRKKKVNEKIARLKMYGEPPPLSTIHIINRSKNASSSYKSPLMSNNNNSKVIYHDSKIEHTKPPNLKPDSSINVASSRNTPGKSANPDDVDCSPVLMNKTYVKSVNPVKINFDVLDKNDSTVDHFAEEFDASPPLSLD